MFARSSSAFLYVLLALTAFVATTCASHTTVTNVNDYGTTINYNYGRGEPSASSVTTTAYETPVV